MNDIEMYKRESGLSDKFIEEHLHSFTENEIGGSYLLKKDAYKWHAKYEPILGYKEDCSNYILNSDDMDKIIKESKGDLRIIEQKLGLPENHLGDGPIYRIDVRNPSQNNIRMATGKEMGANELFNTQIDLQPGDKLDDIYEVVGNKEIKKAGIFNKDKDNPNRKIPVIRFKSDKMRRKYKRYFKSEYYEINGSKKIYHDRSLQGYKGRTSGGYREAVVDCVPNNRENVQHRVYASIDGSKGKVTTESKPIPIMANADEANRIDNDVKNIIKQLESKNVKLNNKEKLELLHLYKSIFVKTIKKLDGLKNKDYSLRELYNGGGSCLQDKNVIEDIRELRKILDTVCNRTVGKDFLDVDRMSYSAHKGKAQSARSAPSVAKTIGTTPPVRTSNSVHEV